jgi:hypothetical protein
VILSPLVFPVLTEGVGSLQLTSMHLLVQSATFKNENILTLLQNLIVRGQLYKAFPFRKSSMIRVSSFNYLGMSHRLLCEVELRFFQAVLLTFHYVNLPFPLLN